MPAFRSRPPYLMTEMIAAEPALADRLVHRLAADEAVDRLASLVRDATSAGRPILVTGCGTSEHAAMGIAEMLNEALEPRPGHGVRVEQALETLARPIADGLLIGVSHEGGTLATSQAMRAAREAGAHTALITVGSGSPGAEIAETVIATGEQDRSWCHTVGYLSPLLAGMVVAARLRQSRVDARALRALLDVSTDTRAAADAAAGLTGVDRLIVVGSGADRGSARELALKVAEGARLPAVAHDLETVLHGHLAAATRWTGLVLILSDLDRPPIVVDRARQVLAAARTLGLPGAAILGQAAAAELAGDLTPAGRLVLPRTGRIKAVAGGLLGSAMALQVLTERLARARHVNPDTLGREDPAQTAAHS